MALGLLVGGTILLAIVVGRTIGAVLIFGVETAVAGLRPGRRARHRAVEVAHVAASSARASASRPAHVRLHAAA